MPLTCFLCGRDFGKKSLGIHLPACERKWSLEEFPQEPKHLEKILHGDELSSSQVNEYNQEAYNIWKKQVLVKCQNCDRSFFPDKLTKHQKCCKEEKPMINPNSSKGNASRLEELLAKEETTRDKKRRRRKRHVSESPLSLSDFPKTGVSICGCGLMSNNSGPTLDDFIYEIQKRGILEDHVKCRQLWMLLQLFSIIKSEPKYDLKLPSIQ